jgi:hypothetical protein
VHGVGFETLTAVGKNIMIWDVRLHTDITILWDVTVLVNITILWTVTVQVNITILWDVRVLGKYYDLKVCDTVCEYYNFIGWNSAYEYYDFIGCDNAREYYEFMGVPVNITNLWDVASYSMVHYMLSLDRVCCRNLQSKQCELQSRHVSNNMTVTRRFYLQVTT